MQGHTYRKSKGPIQAHVSKLKNIRKTEMVWSKQTDWKRLWAWSRANKPNTCTSNTRYCTFFIAAHKIEFYQILKPAPKHSNVSCRLCEAASIYTASLYIIQNEVWCQTIKLYIRSSPSSMDYTSSSQQHTFPYSAITFHWYEAMTATEWKPCSSIICSKQDSYQKVKLFWTFLNRKVKCLSCSKESVWVSSVSEAMYSVTVADKN